MPTDTNVRYELANGESRLGQMLLDGRRADAAVAHLSRSANLLFELLRADASNANFQRGESIAESQLAAALRGTGHVAEAVSHNQSALRIAEALSQSAPKSVQYRIDVGITERKLSDGLLAAGSATEAEVQAQKAIEILCPKENITANRGSLANCGRAQLAAGNASLVLHDLKNAEGALRKAEQIASGQVNADPKNAIARSDAARAQAALASAIFESGDRGAAVTMYVTSLESWSALRKTKTITAEDSYRSDQAAAALDRLRMRP